MVYIFVLAASGVFSLHCGALSCSERGGTSGSSGPVEEEAEEEAEEEEEEEEEEEIERYREGQGR